MIRLALREVRAQYGTWVGFVVVIVAASALTFLALSLSANASVLPRHQSAAVKAFTSPALGLTLLATVVVLSNIANLALRTHKRVHALWSLAGATPRQVVTVAAIQIFLFALAGILIGLAAATLTVDAAFKATVRQALPGFQAPAAHVSASAYLVSAVLVLATVLLSTIRGLNSARAVDSLSALEQVDHRSARVGWLRCIFAVASAGAAAALLATLAQISGSKLADVFSLTIGLSVLFCISLTALAAALGPVVFPFVMRGWTAIVPPSCSSSWYLARNACVFHLTRSGAAIAPLMVAMSIAAGVYTVFLTGAGAQAIEGGAAPSTINDGALALMFAGPLLICAIGAAATMFMTGASRQQDLGLLAAVGADRRVLTRSVLWEAVIYCTTALLVASCAVAGTGAAATLAFGRVVPGVYPVFGFSPGLLVAGGSLIVVLLAVAVPAMQAIKSTSQSWRVAG